MGERSRVVELDGLRGIAIALVVAHHAYRLPGGWVGVSLFFALSGYLITSLLLEEHRSTGDLALPGFYWRRVARLAPALLVALAVTGAVWQATGAGLLGWMCVLVALAYLANVVRAFAFDQMQPTSWAWSLSLEEQFYLLWPPLLRRALRRGVPLRRLARWLVLAAVTIQAGRLALPHSTAVTYDLIRGDELALGAALALVPRMVPPRTAWLGLAGLAGMLLVPFGWYMNVTITAGAWVSIALVAAVRSRTVATRWLTLAPLRYLGRISYALYLWNGVLTFAPWHLDPTVNVALQLLAAVLSTHLLEEPLRRRLTRPREASPAPVLAAA